MLGLAEALQLVVLNCIYIVVGVTVATYLMPYLVGKRMIRGMMKAASEVFDERARKVVMDKLGETMSDPSIRNFAYQIFLKFMTDPDIMSAVTGSEKKK